MQDASARGPAPVPECASAGRALTVVGRVQGVGFRPFVYRLAHHYELAGWVCNAGGEVHIHVEGPASSLAVFARDLLSRSPPLASPDLLRDDAVAPQGFTDFTIRESESEGPARIHVPPDQFACEACLAELRDPRARRHRYPFINCTQCGPRYTIIRAMPYDRPNTTLADFALCADCRDEYNNPLDRRFHAQPLACPECGPGLTWSSPPTASVTDTERALGCCLAALRRGEIVAVRGIGGYHLLCDAADPVAIERLRERKHRPDKPLAVMIPTAGADGLDWARRIAGIHPAEATALLDPRRPIVLSVRRADAPIARAIAPALEEVGLMLPYSPLHHLLLEEFARPLVATSGNLSGEPVLTDPAEAEKRLGAIVDGFLHHNRPIERPADDPVLRPTGRGVQLVRLGRGIAPLELGLPFRLRRPILAVGAFMKTTVALAWDDRVVVSPHIGDLASPRARRVFEQVCTDLQNLYAVQAEVLACDAHPDFPNSRWARSRGLPVIEVFHHYAHASAAAAEVDGIDDPLLCFAWDGTGLGEDGTLWGGEALLGGPGHWRRAATWRPFRLPGGEQAIAQPWRSALGLCWETGHRWETGEALADPLLRSAWRDGLNSPWTSSVGRLFDAGAAIVGDIRTVSYDGQAPMQLETLAHGATMEVQPLPLQETNDGLLVSDWSPLLPRLFDASCTPGERSALIHATLAQALVNQASALRQRHGVNRVALTGGVFQNRLLVDAATAGLEKAGFAVLLPEQVPVNDGGIAYGQVIEAAAQARACAPER